MDMRMRMDTLIMKPEVFGPHPQPLLKKRLLNAQKSYRYLIDQLLLPYQRDCHCKTFKFRRFCRHETTDSTNEWQKFSVF